MNHHENSIALLKELTEAPAIPSFEDKVRAIVARELQPWGTLAHDRNGSVYCECPSKPESPRVLIASHMDEVGFMVQNITPEGFIEFVALGAWWPHTLLAQRVNIIVGNDTVTGVISSTPPHFLNDDERKKVLPLDKLFIDVGASSREEAETEFGIRVGDPIAPDSRFTPMRKKGLFMAKAFDNRVGVALMIESLQELSSEDTPNSLIGLATVQEEVGIRGAETASRVTRPDVAIVLEGAPADDTPGFDKNSAQGKLGGGVQIRIMDPTAIMNPRLVDFVRTVATENGIPHQCTVRRGGGTDAKAIQLSREGVPVVVLAVPARYIHSHNSIIDISDYVAARRLITALSRKLDQETSASLVDYLAV